MNRLTIIEEIGKTSASDSHILIRYQCRCGKMTVQRKATKAKSCGFCFMKNNYWSAMIARCYNPKHKKYQYYGGRGITVCIRWREEFFNFLDDMGKRPEGMTLDRIENNGNYEKINCKWSTNLEQQKNKRIKVEHA